MTSTTFCSGCSVYYKQLDLRTCPLCGSDGEPRELIADNLYKLELSYDLNIFFEKQPKPICGLLDDPDILNKIEKIRLEIIKLRKWGNIWKKLALSKSVLIKQNDKKE